MILSRRAGGAARKKVSILTGKRFGWHPVKNVGRVGFEILGQTGVPPVTYPYLAGMAVSASASPLAYTSPFASASTSTSAEVEVEAEAKGEVYAEAEAEAEVEAEAKGEV